MAEILGIAQLNIPMSDGVKKFALRVNVTGKRQAKIRVWLGCHFMKLAAMVMGCQCEISFKDDSKPAFPPSLYVPPIRLSVSDLGRGTLDWGYAARIKVLLDGVEVRDVLAYDGDAGWIERNSRDAAGNYVFEGRKLTVERVHGTVTAELREGV